MYTFYKKSYIRETPDQMPSPTESDLGHTVSQCPFYGMLGINGFKILLLAHQNTHCWLQELSEQCFISSLNLCPQVRQHSK